MRTKSPNRNIPNLDNLYNVTRNYVKEHQGVKGYIDTNDPYCDGIFAIYFDFELDNVCEHLIVKIRVDSNNDLQVLAEGDNEWQSVKNGDVVYYINTLFSIAESIEEYVN